MFQKINKNKGEERTISDAHLHDSASGCGVSRGTKGVQGNSKGFCLELEKQEKRQGK